MMDLHRQFLMLLICCYGTQLNILILKNCLLVVVNPNSGYDPFLSNSLTSSNTNIRDFWQRGYSNLYHINKALEGITASNNLSVKGKEQLGAELKFNRVLNYFYLINSFGGVPFVISSDYKISASIPRTSKRIKLKSKLFKI
jgi:starch-binding outer membrane protein, SusD/RagB family